MRSVRIKRGKGEGGEGGMGGEKLCLTPLMIGFPNLLTGVLDLLRNGGGFNSASNATRRLL